ncbi:hypothetical protein DC3_03950 [Deinococcus cellulosilyticus NBRC 106333 = KACC 11606]|uniref:Uncharacterized protein n=2 Tax=Deinococcus cellulosilyticus TaxID=401558 RepID=A0A511MW30_DEIC1|nr:hypothetical protein DC3_03950 [Deinococcus cellulosilyticus NBRC 106333 = KACC 11606]
MESYINRPFSFTNTAPLTVEDYRMGCLIKIEKQFNGKFWGLTAEDEEASANNHIKIKPGNTGAIWFGRVDYKNSKGQELARFFSCEIFGSNPHTARIALSFFARR